MKETENTKKKTTECSDEFDLQACSAMDCTGLVPSPPRSEAELDSYEELYPFLAKALPVSSKSENSDS
ncbi:MAG: hypothetical protein Q4E91_00920 [Lachnospiraceae bacterium]|nr:hypothetical protein [Lachnospiraceae bacterium]